VWVGFKFTRPVGLRENEIPEEDDGVCSSVLSSFNVGGRLEQLNLNTQAQSVCSRCEVSEVIDFCLELVITLSGVCSEVVVCSACTLTTTSMLNGVGCAESDILCLVYGFARLA